MKKKITALFLAFALSLSLASPAFATYGPLTPQEAADYLYEKGLFKGAGTGQDGTPIYNLDQTATRGEGITMFVRLLGKENEVTDNTYTTPFTDVPSWAKGYVGYAYTNGLTKGTSETTFQSSNLISSYEFLTLCLRALGYAEGTEFTYKDPVTLATSIGIIAKGEWADNSKTFTRGDMVVISYHVLNAKKADGQDGDTGGANFNGNGIESADKVIVKEIDAGNANNLLPADDGNYYLPADALPDGTAITRDDLVYTTGASTAANLDNFTSILTEINPTITMSSKGLAWGGKVMCDVYSKDGFWKVTQKNWLSGSTKRNFTLTSMHYFGEANMAKAVYGMIDEHYRFRTDKTIPISDELAAKYGLTILQDIDSGGNTQIMVVTDRTSVWNVMYHTEDATGYLSPSCTISIPIRGLAEAESFELANAA